jgi:hypothetical protein
MIAKIETATGHDRTTGEVRDADFGVQWIDRMDQEACVDSVLVGLRRIESGF